MSGPVFSETTERVWGDLPDAQREQDALQPEPAPLGGDPGGHPLKRYLSVVGDQLGDVDTLLGRLAYSTPDEGGPADDTSDLVDPWTADPGWLGWLGQLVGVRRASGMTDDSLRQAIASTSGFRPGTREAVGSAVKPFLTGTKYVDVLPHSATDVGNGTQWDLLVITRASETPGGLDVVGKVLAAGVKPAGVVVHHRAFSTTWGDLQTGRPTWAAWNGETWVEIEETGF